MDYVVKYCQILNGRSLTETFITDVEMSENPSFEEEQKVFLPEIKSHAGHTNVKLLSYSEL
ncbi:hypothetical protein ACIQGW_04405 [Lysinibacillus xylanilyticus]|uniref:hypothetical protein n=1 Tax=Lysinibacillus xylanilyticus TaxID=582475 RepID=UPI0038298B1F